MTDERPLTRRELRERERAAAQAAEPRPLTRRELRERMLAEEGAAAETAGDQPVARVAPRRPVQEPTTTSSIPAYGSLHVPLDMEPEDAGSPAEAEVEAGVEATTEPEETVAAMQAVESEPEETAEPEETVAAMPVVEPEPEATAEPEAPERVSVLGRRDDADASPSSGLPEPWERPREPEEAVEEPAAARRPSALVTVLRYVVLVIAFFIIGGLIWMFIDSQMGDNQTEGSPATVYSTRGLL